MSEINNQRVYIKVVNHLKKEIEKNNILPGNILPTERNLASKLKCSRTSVKEAMAVMESEGLIEIKRGSGSRLLKNDIEDILLRMQLIINSSSSSIINLIELREAIETKSAYLAALRREEKDLIGINNSLVDLKKAIRNKEIAAKEDLSFHINIAKASKNLLFVEVMYLISNRLLDKLKESRSETKKHPGESEKVYKEHTRIFEAIEESDPDLASQMMRNHLNNVKKRYK